MKKARHTGWWIAKVRDPETLAEHSFRTAVIAHVIAHLEGESEERALRACLKALLHDVHETRLVDLHKIASRYHKVSKRVIARVEREQNALLPAPVGKEFIELLEEKEDVIVKDADYLEMAFTAREYFDAGCKGCWDWISRVEKVLRTKSARALLKELKKTPSNSWWKGLKQKIKELRY